MAIYSKKFCQERVNLWLDAEAAVATGQSYQIGTRSLTRANLTAIRNALEYWMGKLAEAEAEENGKSGRNRMYHFVPRDA